MGIPILVLMVLRLVVRLATAKPPHVDFGHPLRDRLGVWAHWAFCLAVIGMCASGLATANIAGLPANVFQGSGAPLPESLDDIAPRVAHGVLATVLMLLILAHVAAALFHHFVRKDGLIGRMWFGDRNT